ncbi:Alpha/Beta hydrolase protein [Zychaea mexicana]|uniref:Alpha/Beta hydrolase protein n=1 Tax=Zychaea mexicana TaxID=64656 RepID=UPI0022FEECDA|nr:Alpha/Beta hydrolase protein [Zychaea mexicana]KAI9497206.1 Alpha/Beta hydrolase protein [Zychaea mexicana]
MIYAIAVLQTAVAPAAFMYYLYYLATDELFITFSPAIDTLLYYWLGCELIFYVFFQITRNRMQSPLPPVYPGPKERRTLYYNCINNIIDVEEWLSGWFMRAHDPEQNPTIEEIRRENLAEWIAWAFFAQPLEGVLEDEAATDEMYWMIDHFAEKFELNFTPGYDEDIIAFRLTLDPVQAYHRPLVFYLFIISMTYLNTILMHCWGFKKFGPDIPSALSLWSNTSEAASATLFSATARSSSAPSTPSTSTLTGRVAYWYREGKRTDKKPIIFIHGIGPGLLPYLKFVYHLIDIDAPLFCVEQPYVSMRCVEDVPSMQEAVQDLERMLHHHGFRDAVYVSHSLGTALTSWAVQHIPKTVAGVVMLDPICFMLHYKDICVNFVYRIPKTASESIVKFFASSELYISYYISRHFHWFQLALYVTPQQPRQTRLSRRRRSQHQNRTIRMPLATKVFLSEHDNIVNSSRVHDYLAGNGISSTVMAGLDHGWFLFKSAWQQEILETVADYTSN